MATIIRKSATKMSFQDWEIFARALVKMKSRIVNPQDQEIQQYSVYDQLVATHTAIRRVRTPDGSTTNMGHQSIGFCPWHREYLIRFENAMREEEPTAFLPYWDWTDHEGVDQRLFTNKRLGARNGPLTRGYFAYEAPGMGQNTTNRPSWWPNNFDGWRIPQGLQYGNGAALTRVVNNRPLATTGHIDAILDTNEYEDGALESWTEPDTGRTTFIVKGFRGKVEFSVPRSHNFCHGWIGGHMGDPRTSPNDPIFYLHHAYIDKIWATWQSQGHAGDAYYPSTGFDEGHNLKDAMWPWIGATTGYQSLTAPIGVSVLDYSNEDSRSPEDLLDISGLGYEYN